MFELLVETDFSAAHRLRDYEGNCERLHGHNYRVELALAGRELNPFGMVLDFKDARAVAQQVVGRLDHQFLNEIEPFDRVNPTTEHIARYIAEELAGRLPPEARVRSVTCWESERSAVRYSPECG